MKVEKLDQYLRIAKAAKMLGVSQNTLRSWADSGRIAVHVNPVNGSVSYTHLTLPTKA